MPPPPKDSAVIAVVDDDPDFAEIMTVVLGFEGFTPVSLPSARAALDYFRHQLPSLAIIDYRLPDLLGVQLVETMRSDPQTRDLPVVLTTALDRRYIGPLEEAARRLDAVLLLKPSLLDTLAGTIRVLLGGGAVDCKFRPSEATSSPVDSDCRFERWENRHPNTDL